ncbi:hypothetical protein SCFA_510009 [anaerobic digester metagenome]|uniref:Uncharacterized protein n=1 Tax=anaerobic digester metagenome TaxID=1263854 RepID=A0A485M1Y1_9ZZZZ
MKHKLVWKKPDQTMHEAIVSHREMLSSGQGI